MPVDGKQAVENAYGRIGDSIPRVEDLRLLTGKGSFTDDFVTDDALHAVFVRSPHAYAKIRAIDATAAPRSSRSRRSRLFAMRMRSRLRSIWAMSSSPSNDTIPMRSAQLTLSSLAARQGARFIAFFESSMPDAAASK